MKYRMLNTDELEGLKDEFVQFMIVNGIGAEDWNTIRVEQNEKARSIIATFSDFIFENILNKTQFLEFFSNTTLLTFKCNPSDIELTGIEGSREYTTTEEMIKDLVAHSNEFTIYKQKKDYHPDRNMELFRMLESGAVITDHKLFDYLDSIIVEN